MSILIERIAKHFDLRLTEIVKLIQSAPSRYKVYPIPKRKEGEFRIIAQPAKEVKILQYWVIDNILNKFPVHKCALAYIRNKNIRDNAIIHSKSKYLLRMDFEKFFPSIKPKDFREYFKCTEHKILSDEDIEFAIYILFWKPKGSYELELSIGAPSSPLLSNILMLDFDNMVNDLCERSNVNYSRYSDDLTFSTNMPQLLNMIYDNINTICNEIKYPSLKINDQKTIYSSKRHRRRVTGLILTNDEQISYGRDKKREIRTKIHLFTKGYLDHKDALYLKGLLAFVKGIEPEFVKRMENKFGKETIESILKYKTS